MTRTIVLGHLLGAASVWQMMWHRQPMGSKLHRQPMGSKWHRQPMGSKMGSKWHRQPMAMGSKWHRQPMGSKYRRLPAWWIAMIESV